MLTQVLDTEALQRLPVLEADCAEVPSEWVAGIWPTLAYFAALHGRSPRVDLRDSADIEFDFPEDEHTEDEMSAEEVLAWVTEPQREHGG